ncbi:hypothetical protein JMJ35_009887 [Cladonia borealis]|uniref:Uncharacterized protein n=1 Tax=Cladonia borealis TaxID=184061 RepID=A0AA39QUJ7_9LECA|nr:hypothetical protein JMJ35_009887 [Cladonia borealis]
MRILITRPLPILAILLPFTTAVTLSAIQQINGFSPACENAYNTPLSGCTATDFSSGVCSGTCIAFLDALTQIINAECTGTSAEPDTLMGSFFQNQGTGVLCPNAPGGSNPGQSSGGSYTSTTAIGAVPSTTVPSTTVPSTTVPTTTSIAITTTFTPSSTVQVTSILSASGMATTTSDIIAITTVTPNAPSSMSSIKSSDVKQSSTSTSSASTSASSSSGSGGGGNGGGTILDVGSSSSCRNAKIKDWVLFLLAGSAGLALLL